MGVHKETYYSLTEELKKKNVRLVAVSKTKPVEEIKELYDLGHRDFGENYVQELVEKQSQLPLDIRWHFIGHLQTNKVKYIAPFVSLIHSADSLKILTEIDKHAQKNNRVIDCLLQVHIAREETKFGLDEEELEALITRINAIEDGLKNVCISGLMGMASFTNDFEKIRNEFRYLKKFFDTYAKLPIANCQLHILSMGMSSDYTIAIEEGSNMVRIGSILFGERI